MRAKLHIILILLASLLASCDRTNQADRVDITFVSSMQDEVKQTKAGGDSDPLYHDFWAWGYKTENQTVIAGYKVSYAPGTAGTSEDNSHDYTYVGNTSLSGEDQTIKFWDFSASEYNFWGATLPITPANPWNADGTLLTISGLNQSTTAPAVDDKLFSARLHREPVSSDVVRLEFLRPYTKVRVLFFTNAPLSDEKVDGKYFDNIQIEDITFGPENPDSDAEKNIITAGTLKVTYDKSGDVAQTYATDTANSVPSTIAKWSYRNITLDCEHGTASNNAVIGVPNEPNGEEYYYAIPNSYTTPFVMKATIDNEEKTAVVPQNFMLWKPNMVFTYLFKISGGNQIELYDVHIDAWKFGGSIEEEWKNW